MREALDSALERNAPPELVADLRSARGQYKAMKTVEDLVEKSPTGNISPAALLQPVRNSYGTMAYGGGGDLADGADRAALHEGTAQLRHGRTGDDHEHVGQAGSGLAGGAAAMMGGSPWQIMGAAATTVASLLAARGVRSFLGSDAATNRLLAASLGRRPAPSVGNKLMNAAALPGAGFMRGRSADTAPHAKQPTRISVKRIPPL